MQVLCTIISFYLLFSNPFFVVANCDLMIQSTSGVMFLITAYTSSFLLPSAGISAEGGWGC